MLEEYEREKKLSNKISLTKVLALGATSAALLGGALLTSQNTVDASSSVVLLKFKHNAYRYDKNGKRIGKGYIVKGSTYYSKGVYKIHGKKYYKLDTKGNIFIKAGNLSTRRLTDQVTLERNAYLYNKNGKRLKGKLYKGVSYFIYGSRYINGKKYYQVGAHQYIKAVNASAPFSTYGQDNNETTDDNTVSNNTVSNNSSNVVNNQPAQNNSSANNSSNNSNTQQQSKPSQNNNVTTKPNTNNNTQTTKPSDNQNANTKPNNNNNNQVNKPNNGNQGQTTTPVQPTYSKNYVVLPAGYLETVKKADWEKTKVSDDLIRQGVHMNHFHSESKADDEMKIDSERLTPEQNFEINDFALRLINTVRAQNGQQPWYYTPKAQHVADRVAYLYEQDGMGLSTWHDNKALNQVDSEFGIHTAELMAGDNVNYKEDYLHTMTDLKRAVYNDVVEMLFSTVELRHAQILLTYNSVDNSSTAFGFSVSWQERNKQGYQEHSDHFIAY